MVTKFEQEVRDTLRHLPLKYNENRVEPNNGLEIDLVVTEYKGEKLKHPLAIEVNGVFHYSRNSE